MWSIGCIVAELVLLDQLVPTGSNDVDQQTRVYNRLGRPGPEFIRLIRDQAVRTPCQHDRVIRFDVVFAGAEVLRNFAQRAGARLGEGVCCRTEPCCW
jgi:hypothetical protein